jgi:hypothetical protein
MNFKFTNELAPASVSSDLLRSTRISDFSRDYCFNNEIREWIATVSSWPPNFKYIDMKETGIKLSKVLRDPNGEHRCDIIIALTHARYVTLSTLVVSVHSLSEYLM